MDINKCAVIISGGTLDEELVFQTLLSRENKFIIGVDHGVRFLYEHGMIPDYIVGDFDSLDPEILEYYQNETKVKIHRYQAEKDASDTEIAVRLALQLECKEAVLLGATGSRLDHVWANIQTLRLAYEEGLKAEILDVYNRIRVIGGHTILKKAERFGAFFSVFSISGMIEHFSIQGAKYPLTDHRLDPIGSLCVSNEYEEDVTITFPAGNVVLMETRDRRNS